MHKLFITFLLMFFVISNVFAYSIKVYDEYGNRVGTYRKEGENYVLYDFNDKKVEQPETIIKDVPTQKSITEYTRTYYDSNMMPIGSYRSGFYANNGRYYPAGVFYPSPWYSPKSPAFVCPRANNYNMNNNPRGGTVFVDTRFPQFHKFR